MTNDNKDFNTHIKEPRWQQIVSVIIMVILIGLWLWSAFHR
jgi:membrane protein involved in colicin uptake